MPVLAQGSLFSRPYPISKRSSRRSKQGARSPGMEIPNFYHRNSEFLRISRLLRRFIQDFSKIAKPMTKLLQKEAKFNWTSDCEAAFQKLKILLTTAPILTQPDVAKPFDVYCDASGTGLGCVLMQGGRVIAYASR